MVGLSFLQKLPIEIKTKINSEFGSIEELYKLIFNLHSNDYKLFISKPSGFENERQKIKQELYQIEDKLESFGITDGSDITNEIMADHGEIIVNKHVQKLDNYLSQFGTDFKTVREWMKRNYGI